MRIIIIKDEMNEGWVADVYIKINTYGSQRLVLSCRPAKNPNPVARKTLQMCFVLSKKRERERRTKDRSP